MKLPCRPWARRPKGIAEEVETGVLEVPSAFRVFAVHDLRLAGMELEAKSSGPGGGRGQKVVTYSTVVATRAWLLATSHFRCQ